MSGGYVPQEVLDSPEIGQERLKLAARAYKRSHQACVLLWENPPQTVEGGDWPETIEWSYDTSGYDTVNKGRYQVTAQRWSPEWPDASSFKITHTVIR